MKKSLILFAAGLLATAGVANAATFTANASANLITGLSVNEDTALNFGKISIGTAESVITLTNAGVSVTSGDATHHGESAMGAFTLIGDGNHALGAITVAASGTLTDGTNTLNATYALDGTAPTVLDGAGEATFNVVGTLTIPVGAVAGAYTGTYEITYSY